MDIMRASSINETLYLIKDSAGHIILKTIRDVERGIWVLMTLHGDIIAECKSCFVLFTIYHIRVVEYVWPLSYSLFKSAA